MLSSDRVAHSCLVAIRITAGRAAPASSGMGGRASVGESGGPHESRPLPLQDSCATAGVTRAVRRTPPRVTPAAAAGLVRARDTLAWSPWPRLVGPAPYRKRVLQRQRA